MSTIDHIANGLTGIRNALTAGKESVTFPTNKSFIKIVEILRNHGYISGFSMKKNDHRNIIDIRLKYNEKKKPVIKELKLISKCSQRVYAGVEEIPRVANGYATVIMSTPKGIVTGKAARELNCGGEVLCYVM